MVEQTGDFSEIVTLLKDNPRGMSVTEIADAAHMSRNTVARHMDKLLLSGRVEMRMFGKAKVFFPSKRVPMSAMLNLSSEMVLMTDAELRIVQANDAALAFLSCSGDELIGHHIYEGRASSLCSGVLTEQIRAALRGEVVRGELRLFKDGEEQILDQRLYPLVLQDGKPGVTILLDNITEKIQAETALEQSESMFRRLVETVSDVIWSVDETAVIQYISPQISSVIGYTADELIGKRFSDFMPEGAGSRFSWELTSTVSKENGFDLIEFPIFTKDGRKIYCDFSGTPVQLEEDKEIFLGYNGALRDVSDRRDAEIGAKRWKSFLDAVIDNIPALITVSDIKTHQFYYVNKQAELYLQREKDAFSKTTLLEVLEETHAADVLDAVTSSISFRKEMLLKETALTIHGETKYLSMQTIPMTLSVDREYLLLIAHDRTSEIHERKRQEDIHALTNALEEISSIQDIWNPLLAALPTISGFEAAAVYQRSIFGDYILYRQNGGNFVPAIQPDSIADRIIRKGETAIFDPHRMKLFPEDSDPLMNNAKSLVIMPIVFRGKTVACILLGSTSSQCPNTALSTSLNSINSHISTVASRCFVQEELLRERDRSRKYIEVAGVFLAAVSRDGTIEMINRYGAELLGYKKDDLIGKNWFDTVVPERVRESRLAAFQQMVSYTPGDEISKYEGEVLCSDGLELEIFWRSSILREECGSVSGIVTSGELLERRQQKPSIS